MPKERTRALLKTPPDNGGTLYDHGGRTFVQKASSLFLYIVVGVGPTGDGGGYCLLNNFFCRVGNELDVMVIANVRNCCHKSEFLVMKNIHKEDNGVHILF